MTAGRLDPVDRFADRHLGPDADDIRVMLDAIGVASLDALADAVVPPGIRLRRTLDLPEASAEHELLLRVAAIADRNVVCRSYIGMGYHDCITPPVILRNVLEDPGWYTQYTPYQAEISQGRLEALLAFQTMVSDLAGLPLANASLLDEATAAAEAMSMCLSVKSVANPVFLVADDCHPQTIDVVRGRAGSMGVEVVVSAVADFDTSRDGFIGAIVQYPSTDGRVVDHAPLATRVHDGGGLLVVAADLLALAVLRAPGAFGADIAVGSTQRFGMPMGGGGPHAGFIATREAYARKMPGRIVGVSRDADGKPAYRLAIQTREQHIRRDRATSNICTAQVLPAIVAAMYAVYHGPTGINRVARRVHDCAAILAEGLRRLGHDVGDEPFFDTLRVRLEPAQGRAIIAAAEKRRMNLRKYANGDVGIAVDQTTTGADVDDLLACFADGAASPITAASLSDTPIAIPAEHERTTPYLTHEVFNTHHSETEMLRFLTRLRSRDLSLADSMIPLGSCTMKLNATAEMMPITWPGFARIHPFAPADQLRGYAELYAELEGWLGSITGLPAVSLQPNAGSQGEYAGLMVIRAYHASRGEGHRDVCLIPQSAHGTNPASAVVAGLRVVAVKCTDEGDFDLDDLRARAAEHADKLAAIMVTYPSTYGVFEEGIQEICGIVHEYGGQVYLDGANMNAQVGLCRPAECGADVCHLNLHKTFCIPHGGGGPGMGPIAVADHLAAFLPGHPVSPPTSAGAQAIGAISAAPYGSPCILPISWAYIALMGGPGLTRASETAILSANYMAHRLRDHYDVMFGGRKGLVAHEFIIDCRGFDKTAGIKIDDIAKRLMDYGFHAPTMAWPVPGTLMIEPTESESRAELDRFCDAMISIRAEIAMIESGRVDRTDNVLKNAPHTIERVSATEWEHRYTREEAVFPLPWLREHKFWPPVARIDNPYGDRNLVCTCPSVDELSE